MKLFCDLDGVLADFDSGVKRITGQYPNEFNKIGTMWKQLANTKNFYYTLDFMPDGLELWNNIKHLNPTILTGLPLGKWAHGQKVRWVGENLGWHVPIITCMTVDKPKYADEGDVLIDDRIKTKAGWENAGGIFVLHTNTDNTLQQLKELDLL